MANSKTKVNLSADIIIDVKIDKNNKQIDIT